MTQHNIKTCKFCGFCKYWFDPACESIEPTSPNIGLWSVVDSGTKRMCLKTNIKKSPLEHCSNYKLKIEY